MSSTIYVGKYIDSGSKNDFYHIVGSNRQMVSKRFQPKTKRVGVIMFKKNLVW